MPLSAGFRCGSIVLPLSLCLASQGAAAPPPDLSAELNGVFSASDSTRAVPAPVVSGETANAELADAAQPAPPSAPPADPYIAPPPPAPDPAKPAPPPQPWKPMFFDNDFSSKKKPDHKYLLGEELKEVSWPFDFLPCDSWISTGGELRYRYMDEANRFRAGGPGRSNFDLWRWRHYVDFHVSDSFRVYAEVIDASIFNLDAPYSALGIDLNRWDIQNLFFDLQVLEFNDKPVYFRYGRQELLYRSQRLVSPLDWANTRRNFEGYLSIPREPLLPRMSVFRNQSRWIFAN